MKIDFTNGLLVTQQIHTFFPTVSCRKRRKTISVSLSFTRRSHWTPWYQPTNSMWTIYSRNGPLPCVARIKQFERLFEWNNSHTNAHTLEHQQRKKNCWKLCPARSHCFETRLCQHTRDTLNSLSHSQNGIYYAMKTMRMIMAFCRIFTNISTELVWCNMPFLQ